MTPEPFDERMELLRVLLVEDDDDHAELAEDALREAGWPRFTVVRAASGAEACRRADEDGPFDALVLDYRLGGGTGLSLLDTLRAAGHTMPALVLTGMGSEQIAAEALRAGAGDYLAKPEGLEGNALARALVGLVSRQRLTDALAVMREQAARAAAAVATGRTAAHDLASPLTMILGLAETMLLEERTLSPHGRANLEQLAEEARRAGDLLQRFLRISAYAETPSPVGPLLDLDQATRTGELTAEP